MSWNSWSILGYALACKGLAVRQSTVSGIRTPPPWNSTLTTYLLLSLPLVGPTIVEPCANTRIKSTRMVIEPWSYWFYWLALINNSRTHFTSGRDMANESTYKTGSPKIIYWTYVTGKKWLTPVALLGRPSISQRIYGCRISLVVVFLLQF